jgi:hypothetical protein
MLLPECLNPVTVVRSVCRVAGFVLVASALSSRAFGQANGAPEIHPGSATAALTLLIGALLLMAHRGRRT